MTIRRPNVAFSLCALLSLASIGLAQTPPATAPAAPASGTPAPTATRSPGSEPPVPAAVLAPASAVLARAVEAVGGGEAWRKHASISMRGAMEIPALGLRGAVTSSTIAPNRMVTSIELPGLGKVRTGYDGTNAWAIEPTGGPRLLDPKEKESMARESSMFKDLELDRHWDAIETTGEAEFAGVVCWKVEAKRGDQSAVLWFEKESGLPRGSETTAETQLGRIPVVTRILEYGTFEGLKVATRTETTQMGQKMLATVERVEFDRVDPKDVELPPEIKALLEPEPAAEEDADGEHPAADAPPTSGAGDASAPKPAPSAPPPAAPKR